MGIGEPEGAFPDSVGWLQKDPAGGGGDARPFTRDEAARRTQN